MVGVFPHHMGKLRLQQDGGADGAQDIGVGRRPVRREGKLVVYVGDGGQKAFF